MGPFATQTPDFAAFLGRLGATPTRPEAFHARNFLLDEGIAYERVQSYVDWSAARDHANYPDWAQAHRKYLSGEVFLASDPGYSMSIDPDDDVACPETFRFANYSPSDDSLHLLRVVEIDFIARCSLMPAERIRTLAESVVQSNGGESEDRLELDAILGTWATNIDCRPVFASYWHELRELFGDTPDGDVRDWADRLRDRLGLIHLDPGKRTPIGVLVFRYPVAVIPVVRGRRNLRALVQPSVLDCNHFAAFCPSPGAEPTGHTVDLSSSSSPICREVAHPAMRFKAENLWRVGQIRRGIGPDPLAVLRDARGWHLLRIQEQCGRDDYAADTDSDLL